MPGSGYPGGFTPGGELAPEGGGTVVIGKASGTITFAGTAAGQVPGEEAPGTLRAHFENGTPGIEIYPTDPGSPDAFDFCAGGAKSLTYDQTHKRGILAAKCVTLKESEEPKDQVGNVQWREASFGTQADHYSRAYVYLTGYPPEGKKSALMGWLNAAGSLQGRVGINSNGKIWISDSGNTERAVSAEALPVNQWVRLEWHVKHSETVGAATLRVFTTDADGSSPDYELAYSALNTGTGAKGMAFGWCLSSYELPEMWIDALGAKGTSWFGPSTANPARNIPFTAWAAPAEGNATEASVSNYKYLLAQESSRLQFVSSPASPIGGGLSLKMTVKRYDYDFYQHQFTANTKTGSKTLSNISSFTHVAAGYELIDITSGATIPAGTTILSVNEGAKTAELSAAATAEHTGDTFGAAATDRTEVAANAYTYAPGQTFWMRVAVMLDATFPNVEGEYWQVIAQMFGGTGGTSTGSPPWALEYENGNFVMTVRGGEKAEPGSVAPRTTHKTVAAATKGVWHDFLFGIKLAKDETGSVEAFHRLAGKKWPVSPTVTDTGVNVLTVGGVDQWIYPETGLYRKTRSETGIAYYGGLVIRGTRGELEGSASGTITFGGLARGETVGQLVAAPRYGVTKPPLSLHAELVFPDGSTTRWGSDERDVRNVPRNVTFKTRRYTGFADAQLTLPRRIDLDYPDLGLLRGLNLIGYDGSSAFEGRIGSMPRSLQTMPEITLQAQGWMAHAQDETFTEVFVDRDLSKWTAGSRYRTSDLVTQNRTVWPSATEVDESGEPGVSLGWENGWAEPYRPISEAWWLPQPGITIAIVYARLAGQTNVNFGDPEWLIYTQGLDSDKAASWDQRAYSGLEAGYLTLSAGRTAAVVQINYAKTPHSAPAGERFRATFTKLAVYGNHGLQLRGEDPCGFYASDMIRNIAQRWAPQLDTSGVQETTFPVPHASFLEDIYPYDAWQSLNAYHRWEMDVYEGRKLRYYPVDLTDWDWEIRLSDPGVTAQLQGDDTSSLCNGVTVRYTDLNTGYPGRVSPETTTKLADTNPANPCNEAGIKRYTNLSLSVPATEEAAIQIGRAYLAEFNQAKSPGSLTVTGHVRDRAGHWQPGWKVRAGERLIISDLPNDSVRVVGETDWNHDSKQLTISVDSSFKQLDAILARFGVAIEASNVKLS